MLSIQAVIFFGPSPGSDRAVAVTAFVSYAIFAGVIAWWEHRYGAPAAAVA